MAIIQYFVDLGPTVVLPILIFLFGMILGAKPRKSFIAGITVGIGFIGLNLITGLLGDSLGPAAQQMVERFGLSLNTIDVGWPAASAISYGTVLGSLAIPVGIGVNILLLVVGMTRTLMVDIWNFWHAAFIASLVYIVTNSFYLGLFAMVTYLCLMYLLADIIAPTIKKFYGFPNITFPHGTSAPGFLIALPLNWLFERIPGFKDIEADPESIQKRFGVFGETTVMGLIIGIIMGLLAGYSMSDTLNLGVTLAAVMMLLPRMVALLMEGLTPISEAANAFVKRRFPGRELNIGMDSALSVGHPAVLSSSLILVPITIALAFILPGNKTIPFGDLATITYAVCLMTPVFKGNIVRTVLGGSLYMISILYITSWVAPVVTGAAKAANFDMGNNTSITALVEGGLWPTWLFVWGSQTAPWIIIGIIFVITIGGLYYVNKVRVKGTVD